MMIKRDKYEARKKDGRSEPKKENDEMKGVFSRVF